MFLQYYGLREQPFGMTPDPRFLWSSAAHREAFASLVYGIETGRGFVALIAKPGMGKTTLLFQLLDRMRSSARTAFLFQSQSNAREFFANLSADLGLDAASLDLSEMQKQLNDILVRESQAGRRFVLIIDEAQNLEDSVLESVRMLSNFETPRDKLLQIVLSGQPQLADKLSRPELVQLRQRVSVIANLDALTEEEVARYIEYRLKVAGYRGSPIFGPEILALISDRSEGVPRNINNICFHALSVGFARGKKKIDLSVMEEVLTDLDLQRLRQRRASSSRRTGGVGTVRAGVKAPRAKRPEFNSGPLYPSTDPRRLSFPQPSPPREHFTGRLFWAAAVLTVIIWSGVFWNSPTLSSLRGAAGQLFSETSPRVKAVVQNLQSATKPAPATTGPEVAKSEPQNPPPGSAAPSADSSQAPGTDFQSLAQLGPDPEARETPPPAPIVDETTPDAGAATVEDASQGSHAGRRAAARRPVRRKSAALPQAEPEVPTTGDVVVQSDVSGGRITVDGRNERDWVTPHILKLPPGSYRIGVSKGGFTGWMQVVQVKVGTRRWVMADLGRPNGMLVLKTDPPGMVVYIDGKYFGTGDVQTTLTAGEHTYKVVPPSGLAPFEGTLEVEPGRVLMKKIRWQDSSGLGSTMPDSPGTVRSTLQGE